MKTKKESSGKSNRILQRKTLILRVWGEGLYLTGARDFTVRVRGGRKRYVRRCDCEKRKRKLIGEKVRRKVSTWVQEPINRARRAHTSKGGGKRAVPPWEPANTKGVRTLGQGRVSTTLN